MKILVPIAVSIALSLVATRLITRAGVQAEPPDEGAVADPAPAI